MYNDKMVITSTGGLPDGVTKEEYLESMISMPRNPFLASIFLRLGIIEALGTGIRRIKDSYKGSVTQPQFEVSPDLIQVTLPVKTQSRVLLTPDEEVILEAVQHGMSTTTKINGSVGFSRSKTLQLINSLVDKGYLIKEGKGRATRYLLM